MNNQNNQQAGDNARQIGQISQVESIDCSSITIGNIIIYLYQQFERKVVETKVQEIGPNPYKGLGAFQETDSDRFCGRQKQIDELWQKWQRLCEGSATIQLLPIYGPSGSGKSSLARAGLIPEFAQRPLPGYTHARVVVMVPGTRPLEALASVLARIVTNDPIPVTKTREFARELEQANKEGEYDGLRRIGGLLPNIHISPLIVLVDQFEEVYSLCKNPVERDAFIGNLLTGASNRSRHVSVIVTLRSDFLGETQKHPRLNRLFAEQGFLVPTMDEEELRQAIRQPAERAGHPLDDSTIELLVKETQGREGALPLLQFALTRIWSGLAEGKKPAQTLKALGGVGGALAGEAQRIYDSLSSEEKDIARRVFLGLVQPGEGSKYTRRRTEIKQIILQRDSPEQVKQVIAQFSAPGVRLITLAANTNAETAEVTHEALFDHWQQLNQWLASSDSDIRFERRLDEAARIWVESGRPAGSLWRPPELDLLERYYLQVSGDMTRRQLKFFNASKKEENKRKLLLRFVIGGLIAGFIITTMTTVFAAYQWQSAERERIEQKAITAKNLLSIYPVQGIVSAISALGQSRNPFLNFPHQWVPQSIKGSLISAVQTSRERNRIGSHPDYLTSVAISTDGQTIVSGGEDGIRIWARNGELIGGPFRGDYGGRITSVAISTDGQTIISGSSDGTVQIWARNGEQIGGPFYCHEGVVQSIAISTDGQTFVSGGQDGIVQRWARNGQRVGNTILLTNQKTVSRLAISPDSQTIFYSLEGESVQMWDLNKQQPAEFFKGHQDFISSIAISADGETIISGGEDGTVRMWNRDDQQLADPLKGHQGSVDSVAISTDGQTIVSGGKDGTVRIWDRNGQLLPKLFKRTEHIIYSIAISTDGQTIVSSDSVGHVWMWGRNGQQLAKPFKGHGKGIGSSVGISTDGQTIISGNSDDGTVMIWNRNGELIGGPLTFKNAQGYVRPVAISTDGQTILTWEKDGIWMWDRSGHRLDKALTFEAFTSKAPRFKATDATISTDRQTIVTWGDDGIRIWDRNGQLLAGPFKDNKETVFSVAISADGQTIISGGTYGIRMWNRDGQPLAERFDGNQLGVFSLAISTDGQTIISGGNEFTILMWDLKIDTWLKAACERLSDHPVFKKPESADEKIAKAACEPYLR